MAEELNGYDCKVFQCMCHDFKHMLRVCADPDEKELTIETFLDNRYGLWQRIKTAWVYITMRRGVTDFGDTLLDEENTKSLRDLCDHALNKREGVET